MLVNGDRFPRRVFARLTRFKTHKSPRDIDRAIQFMVQDAHRHVPYYRHAFSREGISPGAIRGCADLAFLPITTKEALLTSAEGGWLREGTDLSRCFRTSTSGTTGMVLTVRMTRPEMYYRRISLLLAMGKSLPLRLPLTLVDVGAPPVKRQADLAQRLGLVRVAYVPLESSPADQIRVLRQLHPTILEGRPSLLKLLADEIQRRNIADISCDLIATTGEVLHHPVRELLQQAFSAKVRDYYNCDEVGNLAWECPENPGTMHVNTDTCVLEVVDEEGALVEPGCEGRVLVTSLYNRTMPFIRYAIGDRAVLQPPERDRCSCGHRGPSMRLLGGRDEDYLVFPGGKQVSPRIPYRMVWDQLPVADCENRVHDVVRSFQLVQETHDRFVLRVAPGPKYEPGVWDGLEEKLRSLHPNLRLSVRLEESLNLAAGAGKFSSVVSHVGRPSAPGN